MSDFRLSEENMNRIRAEEVFRAEVRDKLAREEPASSDKPSCFWTFLNSQFAGWLLSTVLVGLTVYFYGAYADYRTRQASRAAQREKIADEVAFQIQSYERERKAQQPPDPKRCRRALDGEYPPGFIYPDLANRKLVSLLWELAFLCDKPETKHTLRAHVHAFSDVFDVSSSFTAEELDREVRSLGRQIAELLPNDHTESMPPREGTKQRAGVP